jgi:cell division protein FtsB
MTSVFVGTVVFLLHSTNVNKKMEALKAENELLRAEIEDVITQNSKLRSELSIALDSIERIKDITSS